jgi:hypothetical protein
MLTSFTHLLYCTTYSTFLNPPPPRPRAQQPHGGQGRRGNGASRLHADAPHQWRNSPAWARAPTLPWLHDHTQTQYTIVGLLSTSDRPTQRPLCDNTQHSQETHPCPRRDSNSQSQQANGGRPTPYTARPLGSAKIFKYCTYSRGTIG